MKFSEQMAAECDKANAWIKHGTKTQAAQAKHAMKTCQRMGLAVKLSNGDWTPSMSVKAGTYD